MYHTIIIIHHQPFRHPSSSIHLHRSSCVVLTKGTVVLKVNAPTPEVLISCLCLVCRLLQVVILVCAIVVVISSALVNLPLDNPILSYSACLCASLLPSYLAGEIHRGHVDHECKPCRCSRDIISLRNRPRPMRASSRRVQRAQSPLARCHFH